MLQTFLKDLIKAKISNYPSWRKKNIVIMINNNINNEITNY